MASSLDPLTSFNYHQWKEDMEIQLCSRGLYWVTMNTELEPNVAAEKIKYWNKLDEAYGFFCLSISKDILFHISGLKTPKDIWDHIATLFDKHVIFRSISLRTS